MTLPGTARLRRRLAVLFLGLGAVFSAQTLSHKLPHEQTLVFRLPPEDRSGPLTVRASITRVGENEASAGVTFSRDGSEPSDPRQTLSLPNGDYVVALEWEKSAQNGARHQGETTSVERVTLGGGETVVPLRQRVPE